MTDQTDKIAYEMQKVIIVVTVQTKESTLTWKGEVPYVVAEDIGKFATEEWKDEWLFTMNEIEFYNNFDDGRE